jgi:hypothetical protein
MNTTGLTSAAYRFAPVPRYAGVLQAMAVLVGLAVLPAALLMHSTLASIGLTALSAASAVAGTRARGRGIWCVSIDRDGALTSTARCVDAPYTFTSGLHLGDAASTYAGPASIAVEDHRYHGTVVRNIDLLAVTNAQGRRAYVPFGLLHNSPALTAALRSHLVPVGALTGDAVSGPARVLVAA